jgi:hypothetical protein
MRKLSLFVLLLVGVTSCSTMAEDVGAGVVIARSAQVRSSTAVVAADLVEVVRGDSVEILDSTEGDEGERWYHVRVINSEGIEGWIEARNIMPQELLQKSRDIAAADKDIPAQAAGQLRASTNLRLTPERADDENILFRLESGSRFEIVGWKRVAVPKAAGAAEDDDAAPARAKTNANRNKRGNNNQEPVEATEVWYKVRLPRSASPAPAGWLYGKQVELSVPSDIIFYRTGREFVAWQRLDGDARGFSDQKDDEETRPGSWVILEKSGIAANQGADSPEFDRVFVLGYNRETKEHYTAYRSPDVKGLLPVRVQGSGDNKTFSIRVQDGGQAREVNFSVTRDDRGILRVKPQGELKSGE